MLKVCIFLESRSVWELLIEYSGKSNGYGLKKLNALIGLCKGMAESIHEFGLYKTKQNNNKQHSLILSFIMVNPPFLNSNIYISFE